MLKWRIVLLPFPFDDLSATKVRPVVCLTNPIGPYDHVLVAFITSQVSLTPLETDIILSPKQAFFKQTGLKVSSMIQVHRLMTITQGMILRELGVIPEKIQKEILKKLKVFLAA